MTNPPVLMPFQMDAFNADFYIEQEFLMLKNKFGLKYAVETGTCFGSTTIFLAKHFEKVATVEIMPDYLTYAKTRFNDYKNIAAYGGDSRFFLAKMITEQRLTDKTMFFLDAHWGDKCPLREELRSIADMGIKPVIAIHDFKVPGEPGLGYDSWENQEFTFEWLKPLFDKIYGVGNYSYHYNSDAKSTQIKRGIIYLYPGKAIAKDNSANLTQQQRQPGNIVPVSGKPHVILYLNYYNDSNPARQAELTYCLSQNILNPLIDEIVLVVDNESTNLYEFNKFNKVNVIMHTGMRPTYRYFFDLMNSKIQAGNEIHILANTDIYFQEGALEKIIKYINPGVCFALSAWDKTTTGDLIIEKQNEGNDEWVSKNDSQDAWIFRGPVKQVPLCEFSMGRPGCDNAVAACLIKAGYEVFNPALEIKLIHVHITNIRHYDTKDYTKIEGGINPDRVYQEYKLLKPTDLSEVPIINTPAFFETAGFIPDPIKDEWGNWVEEIANIVGKEGEQSQFQEESIIQHIFDYIGTGGNRFFVDLGAGAYDQSGMSNTRKLKESGWFGFGVDAKECKDQWVLQRFITPANVVEILTGQKTPKNFSFLNLDIDGNDFYVLDEVLKVYRPRVICTEFNGTLDPETPVVMKYQEDYVWDGTNKYGYSFAAGKKLLEKHGYVIVFNLNQTDIFAVRKDLVDPIEPIVTAEKVQYHPVNPQAEWVIY